ncbi:Histone deacetylase RPD3; AltName: Full=Transcriptional regulatory protein RPD3 [Serendipita indica DSM 11827]|nr:Histone deacetylase RPD3; AltName: Full=Transcriptional regulatory protein RPD3 [Serendipita indica DSM 11827]
MTHTLVAAYDLLPKLEVLRPHAATPEQMTRFHTDEYIHFLKRVTPETAGELSENGTRYLTNFGYDNPPYEGAFEFCAISAGGSISGAKRLSEGATDIAVNWAGGLHHAKKGGASGFCYINDIVLGILELLRTFPRVLYVDIDCHHGDAVEEAFYTSDRVLTCSLHKFGDFFPGTGLPDDRGVGKGFRYSINVPFRSGLTDENFASVYVPLMDKILARFRPSAVVLQCGADSLAGDRLGQYNLSMQGHADCVRYFRDKGIPLMVLGGGGYTIRNVARTWAYETACVLGCEKDLDVNLPYNQYFDYFGPEYKMEVKPTNVEDLNESDHYLEGIRETVLRQADEIPIAPSVGIHMPPRHSLAEELGLGLDGATHVDGDYDDIDLRIQELSAKFISKPPVSSDTESVGSRDRPDWNSDDENGSDEEGYGTPTRSRRNANRVGGAKLTNGGGPNRFVQGTIPMPATGLLFSNQTAEASGRPPNSVGSVFGSAGRSVTVNPIAEACFPPEHVTMGIVQQMENGGVSSRGIDGRAYEDGRENQTGRTRRFFKSSGIKLRGLNEVAFPLSVLNGRPAGTSWGPAGFEGFGNEAHVMRRGYALSYGGEAHGVAAGGDTEPARDEETTTRTLPPRRGRYSRREEDMDLDGAESD